LDIRFYETRLKEDTRNSLSSQPLVISMIMRKYKLRKQEENIKDGKQ